MPPSGTSECVTEPRTIAGYGWDDPEGGSRVEVGEELAESCDVSVAQVPCGSGDDLGGDSLEDLIPECGCVGCGFDDDHATVGVASGAGDQVVVFEAGEDFGEAGVDRMGWPSSSPDRDVPPPLMNRRASTAPSEGVTPASPQISSTLVIIHRPDSTRANMVRIRGSSGPAIQRAYRHRVALSYLI